MSDIEARKPREINKGKLVWMDINKAWKLSKIWKNAPIIWKIIDHFLVAVSSAASLLTVYIAAESAEKRLIIIFSSTAAICSLIQFAFKPSEYISNYRLAFEELNVALINNTNLEGDFIGGDDGWNEVLQAIEKGEEYIGRTYYVNRIPPLKTKIECRDKRMDPSDFE